MTKSEYHKILFELGILDDDEDWEMYQLQEQQLDDIDDELYMHYVIIPGSKPKI